MTKSVPRYEEPCAFLCGRLARRLERGSLRRSGSLAASLEGVARFSLERHADARDAANGLYHLVEPPLFMCVCACVYVCMYVSMCVSYVCVCMRARTARALKYINK